MFNENAAKDVAKDLAKRMCCVSLDTPDSKRFALRLLLTLYGTDAMTWSWTTVRNAVWLPAFRGWLVRFLIDNDVPRPPEHCLRTVGNLVLSHRSDPDGTSLDSVSDYIIQCMQFYISSTKCKAKNYEATQQPMR